MRSWMLLTVPLSVVLCICGFRAFARQDNAPLNAKVAVVQQAPSLEMPIKKLTLHTNGLALIRREAELTGPATFDLPVPISDVNDWLKSLDVDDPNGRAETVVFDSPEPTDRALQSFAFDLTGNPGFGDLVNQGRGERIEIVVGEGQTATKISGTLLGMEERAERLGEQVIATDYLNIRTDEGLRSVPFKQIRNVKFVEARLDTEMQRALSLIAKAKDESRKTVRVTIPAGPKRKVSLTYVAESPVWKVSYRINATDAETSLRSWALVENTTDEDWSDVTLTLAGGRPVSFQMDLYPPLFVPRPFVDPPRMAVLRPPSYAGPTSNLGFQGGNQNAFLGGAQGFAGGNSQPGGIGGGGFGALGGAAPRRYLQASTLQDEDSSGLRNRYQYSSRRGSYDTRNRITLEEYERRQKETSDESKSAKSASSPIIDEPLGTPARHVIDRPVTIPRHKSALIPLFTQNVSATNVAVYSPDVHPTRPLSALRFKNESGQMLGAGPITIYSNQTFAGDARITDWPVNETRFVGFAIDSDCQVAMKHSLDPSPTTNMKIVKGVAIEERRMIQTNKLAAINRGASARELWVELPLEEGWKLIEPAKADETTKTRVRIRTDVPANQRSEPTIRFERVMTIKHDLEDMGDSAMLGLTQFAGLKASIANAVNEVIKRRETLRQIESGLQESKKQLSQSMEEQGRLRINLEKTPATSELHKRYLDKLSQQETTIEKLQSQIRTAQDDLKKNAEQMKSHLANLNVE